MLVINKLADNTPIPATGHIYKGKNSIINQES